MGYIKKAGAVADSIERKLAQLFFLSLQRDIMALRNGMFD